ncbi:BPSS1780 family membrane protein [Neisseriaceae bacterium TC5R-5]|nr:BPSS1780 family membrane protein [Neisseriaceae bacterium TC5R-5]
MQELPVEPMSRKVAFSRGWAWVVEAFYIVRQQPLTWVLLALAYIVMHVVLSAIPVFGTPLTFFIAPVFAAGFIAAAKKSEHGAELELMDLFVGFKTTLRPLINVGMLYMALIISSLLLLGIFGQFIGIEIKEVPNRVPEISGPVWPFLGVAALLMFLLNLTYWFAPALVMIGQVSPWQAMRLSLRAGLTNWSVVLSCGLMLAMLLFLAILPLGLGLLLWFPVLYVTSYTSWKDVFQQESPSRASGDLPIVF